MPILNASMGCKVATIIKCILLDTARHMNMMYNKVLTNYLTTIAGYDAAGVYMANDLAEVDLCRALQHCLCAMALAPPKVGNNICLYYTLFVSNLQLHVHHHCPQADAASLRDRQQCFRTLHFCFEHTNVTKTNVQCTVVDGGFGHTYYDGHLQFDVGADIHNCLPFLIPGMHFGVVICSLAACIRSNTCMLHGG